MAIEKLRQIEQMKRHEFGSRTAGTETYFPTEEEKEEFIRAGQAHNFLLEEIRRADKLPESAECQEKYDDICHRLSNWTAIPTIGDVD